MGLRQDVFWAPQSGSWDRGGRKGLGYNPSRRLFPGVPASGVSQVGVRPRRGPHV